ncbi:hypothetical protein [uncultured Dokdonia sp.]|uniref:hypothetical protein n=1 Tax=uncultured Dokdonia sp. TaxID=575653 RepID=UPI002626A061|nr:hypothetical protein [uncultured Dokdonia sp.]
MKKLMNLKGANTLNTQEQKQIKGGINPIPIACQVGCAGLGHGARFYASDNYNCLGRCGSNRCITF